MATIRAHGCAHLGVRRRLPAFLSRTRRSRQRAAAAQIMSSALSVPQESTEEDEESDDIGGSSRGAPKILRFNGDKINLHNSAGNGSARRAAAGTRPRSARPTLLPCKQRENRAIRENLPRLASLALAR